MGNFLPAIARAILPLAALLLSAPARAACTGPRVDVVADCGGSGNAKYIDDGVAVLSSDHLTSAKAAFVAGDVGKIAWCTWNSVPTPPVFGVTTIVSRVSATEVVLGTTATASASGLTCVYGTQDDTTAFTTAMTAVAASFSPYPGSANSGEVTVPCGGFIVSSRIFVNSGAPPTLSGAGRTCTSLFPAPSMTIPGDGSGVLIHMTGFGGRLQNFAVVGGYQNFALQAGQDFIRLQGASSYVLENLSIIQLGSTAASSGALGVVSGSAGRITNVTVQNTSVGSQMFACKFTGMNGSYSENLLCSNFYRSLKVDNCPGRNDFFGFAPTNFIGGGFDECDFGNTGVSCIDIVNGSEPNFVGSWFLSSQTTGIRVDGTSKLWLWGSAVGRFGNYTGGRALDIDAGGKVYAGASTFRATTGGNTNNKAVKNNGTFIDMGGNDYRSCTTGHVCTDLTAAQAFTGRQPVRR